MRTLSRMGNFFFYLLIFLILIACLGSIFLQRPFLFSVIRSNSMYPLLARGDLVFVRPLSPTTPVKIGDIILFKTEDDPLTTKGWIMHRIVAGNTKNGFITKGDANNITDQSSRNVQSIKREWITAKALNWGTHVLKCPRLGYPSLWTEQYRQSPYLLPGVALILTIILATTEWQKNKSKKKKGKLDLPLIYIGSGLIISLLLLASMLTTSQKITLEYEVADKQGVLQGSELGILKEGETTERFLAELKNKSFCPFFTIITCSDPQISLNYKYLTLKQNQKKDLYFKITTHQAGSYQGPIWIGMYFPFLPPQVLYQLQEKSIWLALSIVSLLPGLPFILYPFFDRKLRRHTKKEIRRLGRRIKRSLPFHN